MLRSPSLGYGAKRSLRSGKVIEEEEEDADEERVGASPFIEKITSAVKTSTEKAHEKALLALRTSADDAFTKFNVVNGDNLLESQPFTKWFRHVRNLNKNNEEVARTSMASTLAKQIGDDDLVNIIIAAKTKDKKNLANDLEAGLLQNWANNKQSADAVFKLVKLDTTEKQLFANVKIQVWAKYVTKVNNDDTEAAMVAMFKTLSKHYDEVDLAKRISYATISPIMGKLATGLQTAQFKVWIDAGKNADDVFKILKLGDTGKNIFSSSRFPIWENFVGVLHKQQQGAFMASTLATHYGDDVLVKMIEAGKTVPIKESLSTKLEQGLLQSWQVDKMSSNDVFIKLQLQNRKGFLLGSPQRKIWTEFVTKLHKGDQSAAFDDMFKIMAKHYDPETLARYIESAKVSVSIGPFASRLQSVQFAEWARAKTSATTIKKLLKEPVSGHVDVKRDNAIVDAYTAFLTKKVQ
ncbi:RxLR effector protein [Phytophthora cinnamomi]|uniref:RxLR effector protein n=1 Tax=Phytophthora cinnamomi TaxID=4785 RepID=UPI00355A06ED|nr:RxLR effector protein [Phytophthora cinnamomi]